VLGFDLGWTALGGFGTRFGPQVKLGGATGPYLPYWDFRPVIENFNAKLLAEGLEKWRTTLPEGSPARITTSRDLPGSTHWDPAPVPVGKNGGGSPAAGGVVYSEGAGVPVLGFPWGWPNGSDTSEPPVIYSPPPIVLPGQVDPGREEQETEEGELAHTWLHLGSQVVGGMFPGQNPMAYAPSNFGGGPGAGGGSGNGNGIGAIPAPAGDPMYTGSCPPPKTRTLTIDCATGQEVKRKRRRRRALLTQGDMGVLFQIASLPNNANVRVALAGAIRR